MNTADLVFPACDIAVFIVCLLIGRNRPVLVLVAFAWASPYLGANLIGTLYLPLNLGKAVGLALATLVLLSSYRASAPIIVLRERIYLLLGTSILVSAIGIGFALHYAPYVDTWVQRPELRVAKASMAEGLRWLLILAPITLPWAHRCAARVLRHVVYAGSLYCCLGLLQLVIAWSMGIDLFPMIRHFSDGYQLQSVVFGNSSDRVTSLCGEPRYLAAYACLWFLITAVLGAKIGITRWRYPLGCLFLSTIVLSGSRTPVLILGVAALAAALAALSSLRVGLLIRVLTVSTVLSTGAAFMVAFHIGSFGQRNDIETLNDEMVIRIAGIKLPIEWQDVAIFSVLERYPVAFVTGFGSGLWQYYTDPSEYWQVRTFLWSPMATGFNSPKSNFHIVGRLSDYGLMGISIMGSVLVLLYRAGARTRGSKYLVTFVTFVAVSQVAGMADLMAFFILGTVVLLQHEYDVPKSTFASLRSGSRRGAVRILPAPGRVSVQHSQT